MSRSSSGPYILQTPRLRLQPLTPQDVEYFVHFTRHPLIRPYIWHGQPLDRNGVQSLCEESAFNLHSSGFGIWVLRKDGGTPIGCAGLRVVSGTDRVELLYMLDPDYWGRAFATEAVLAILNYGFISLSLPRVEASCHTDNDRSIALTERLGMTRVRTEKTSADSLAVYAIDREGYFSLVLRVRDA